MSQDHAVLAEVRANVREFVAREVEPVARDLDRKRELIPKPLIAKMGELGYLGVVFPQEHGGLGLGHEALCIVTEELSRGWLSVGSVMTRNLITGTVLLHHGTSQQRDDLLPRLASGRLLSAASFTEPNVGSDLGAVEVQAQRRDDRRWSVSGEKTWCTMAEQAELLTVLARTDADPKKRHKGLSLVLCDKPADAWNQPTLTGSLIPSIGYRGLRSYSVFFDGHPSRADDGDGIVGGVPGKGFAQLMSTFESARIQTAARAVGVAQAALDAAVSYARERKQFGKPIAEFQAVRHKVAEMAARTEAARQLTFHAARMKDTGKRCDLEAGMAKIIATETVEFVTREALQVHGAYGYSEEFDAQRYWRDGKVFSVFEGTSEIQLEVIAKQLLEVA